MPRVTRTVSIVVPTRNEAENVGQLVSGIVAQGVPFHEIVFVDGNSTDSTRTIIQSLASNHPIRLVAQDPAERGLAAAVITGAEAATGDFLLVMDGDLSHPVDRITDLLDPLQTGAADMVIGSRYVRGGSTPNWPLWRRAMSRSGAALAYPLTRVHDSMSGFFAISRSRLLKIAPAPLGFKIAFETILRGGPGFRVREIPIAFHDRSHGKSKMSLGVALQFFYQWALAVIRRSLMKSSNGD